MPAAAQLISSGTPTARQHFFTPVSLANDLASEAWDNAKREAESVAWTFLAHASEKVQAWGHRISTCGDALTYEYQRLSNGSGWRRKITHARLCRVRTCPICRWRRSLKLQAEVKQRMAGLQRKRPDLAPVLLTLTVRNCDVPELNSTCKAMLKGWSKLTRRVSFTGVEGWLRAVEVTRGKTDISTAHPHIHALLMVDPVLFNAHEWGRWWAAEWQTVMGLDYLPICDIRPVTSTDGAIAEVSKYIVKPGEGGNAPDWLPQVALQLDRVRAVATGGLMGAVSDDVDEEDGTVVEDLPFIPGPRPPKPSGVALFYQFDREKRKYMRYHAFWDTISRPRLYLESKDP